MRICYLSNSAIPSSVASSIQIVKMCEAFSQLDNKVTLITTNVKKKNLNPFSFYKVKNKFLIKRMAKFKTFPLGMELPRQQSKLICFQARLLSRLNFHAQIPSTVR